VGFNGLEFPGHPLQGTLLKGRCADGASDQSKSGQWTVQWHPPVGVGDGIQGLTAKVITGDARNQVVMITRIVMSHDNNVSFACGGVATT
jgi:hypothetical protein